MAWPRRRKQLGQAAIPDDVPTFEFVETYWRLHAVPNLAPSTREFYKRTWANHIMPRLGDYGVRELTPSRLARFREDLESAGVGTATIVKTMRIVQSILSFAVAEELVEYNAAASVRKPRYERAREPHIFLPAEVEHIRETSATRATDTRQCLAYSGPRPRRSSAASPGTTSASGRSATGTPNATARDSRRYSHRSPRIFASGSWSPGARAALVPSFPPTTADFWTGRLAELAYASLARRAAHSEPTAIADMPRRTRRRERGHATCAQASSRCRSTRGPADDDRQAVGTSVRMIEQHYAGVIANWDGVQRPAEATIRAARDASIRAARQNGGREMDAMASLKGSSGS